MTKLTPKWSSVAIIALSILGGLFATWLMPQLIDWLPYDYLVYVQGAQFVRLGQNPHALLPYWYPLPVVLFTTMPWSYLPSQFGWAFAVIPLGLLHLRYGKRTLLWWLFFPLLINVAYAQMEGWLILPLFWILLNEPIKAGLGLILLMFKPAYAIFLLPYQLWLWWRTRQFNQLRWLFVFTAVAVVAAFLVEPLWPIQWFNGVIHRHENTALQSRNMTVWAFVAHGPAGWFALLLVLWVLAYLCRQLWRQEGHRGPVLLALSLFFFPGGLNPVSSMMIMPLVSSGRDIAILVFSSWVAVILDTVIGGFGGVYLLIVLVALWLRLRQTL